MAFLPVTVPATLPMQTQAAAACGRAGSADGPSSGSGARSGLAWCVVAALGLHAALGLGLLLRSPLPAPLPGSVASVHASHVQTTTRALQVRWAHPARNIAPQSPGQAALHAPAKGDTPALPNGAEPSVAHASTDTDTDNSTSTNALPPAEAMTVAEEAFTGYARRDMLDRAPQALGIVQISYPPGVEPGRVRTGRLTLFIDEAGAVRKVMMLAPPDPQDALPPPFVEAAREAFLQARFAPGERQGVPVKSRIDIEVSFDDRETQAVDTAQQPLTPAANGRSV